MRPSHLDPPVAVWVPLATPSPSLGGGTVWIGGQRSWEQLCCRRKGLGSAPGTMGKILNQNTARSMKTPLWSLKLASDSQDVGQEKDKTKR